VDDRSSAEDELAALRRRAYGPNADIGEDPRAQARLAELEREHASREADASTVSRSAPRTGPAREVDGPSTVGADRGSPTAADARDGANQVSAASRGEAAPNRTARRRLRRALPWVIAAGAGVLAATFGVLYFASMTQPVVEARLVARAEPPAGTEPPALQEDDLGFLETTNPAWVSHGGYGPLEVWSTTAPHNWQCLAVVFQASTWRFNCTVASLDTVADVTVDESLLPTDAPGGPIPYWSTVRFVLHDDVVDVFIGRNGDPRTAGVPSTL